MAKKFRENVEIISSTNGQSGLRLTNLPSGTAQTVFNWILGIDAAGDVIKIDATKIATVTVGPVAPSSPVVGQQWLDTSVSPSELMIYNGTSWEVSNDEVQHYANFAAFPATGDEDVLYVDDAADIVYLWDTTTAGYVNAASGATGLFAITDGTTTQQVGVGQSITFTEWTNIADVLDLTVSATDTVTLSAKAGATTGQTMVFNGTKFVYGDAKNIYNADGTITDPLRTVSLDSYVNTILIDSDSQNSANLYVANSIPQEYRAAFWNLNTIKFSEYDWWILPDYSLFGNVWDDGTANWYATGWAVIHGKWQYWVNVYADTTLALNSINQDYKIITAPTNATTQTVALVRDASDGRLYLKDLSWINNIYTADGTLLADRTVDMDGNDLEFFDANVWSLTIVPDVANWEFNLNSSSTLYINATWNTLSSNADIIAMSAASQEYYIWGSAAWVPTNATTQTVALVRDASNGRLYLKDLATMNARRYATTITPVAWVQQTVTHNLWTTDVIVQVRDATTNEVVSVEIEILTANTIGITSTTTDDLRIVVL